MPATGAIARTAVNARAGARTRVSAIVHSAVLLLVVLVGSGLVADIPLAALAGVLMVTAVRMVEVANVRSVLRATRQDAAVLVLTAAATVAFDLIVAIALGMAVAAVLALRSMASTSRPTETPLPVELDGDEEVDLLREHIVAYRLDGALFFGAAKRFLDEIVAGGDVQVVILRLPELRMLDATGAQGLGEVVADLERRGVTVLLKGARPEHEQVLRAVGALDRLAGAHHRFEDLDAAVAHARAHVALGAAADAADEAA
jgi:SulP family sulfate permease